MPTYVYECRTCQKKFEVEQRITADALTDCECGSKGSLRRLIQPVAVAFKGSGFHINDYSNAKPEASSEKVEAKSEASSESKPATTEVPSTDLPVSSKAGSDEKTA